LEIIWYGAVCSDLLIEKEDRMNHLCSVPNLRVDEFVTNL
jgi:hypothetical protein